LNPSWVSALAIVVAASSLPGQTPAAPAPFDPERVCPQLEGHLARVKYEPPQAGGTLGPVVTCGRDGVTLAAYAGQPGPQIIDAATINRLWSRRGSGLAGGVWGGLLGGLMGYAIASARTHLCPAPPNSPPDQTHCHANIPTGIAVGTIAGAGIGWFFGRGVPRWKIIYRAHP